MMTDRWPRHPDHPVVDEESAAVLEEALHSLTMLRCAGDEGDAGARLHMLASLMAQAQAEAVLADAVADAQDQDYTWAEIAERLGVATATARRRFAYAAATRVVPFED